MLAMGQSLVLDVACGPETDKNIVLIHSAFLNGISL